MSRGFNAHRFDKPKKLLWGSTGNASHTYGFPHSKFSEADTTADGRQVFLWIGDSKAQGDADSTLGVDPVVDANGSGFEYGPRPLDPGNTNTNLYMHELGRFDLRTIFVNGSMCPQFCVDYFKLTGIRPIIANAAFQGSKFYITGGGASSWYTDGTLYAKAVAKGKGALLSCGLKRLKVVIVLGINDVASAETTGNVGTAITSLIDRLNVDFNYPEIYIDQIGSLNGLATVRKATIMGFIRALETTYSNVYETVNENSLYSWGLQIPANGGPHFLQSGNNKCGSLIASYIANVRGETDRDVRRVLNYFYDPISNLAQNEIANGIIWQKRVGNWQLVDSCQFYQGNTKNNVLIDWGGFTAPHDPLTGVGNTWSPRDQISFDGTTQFLDSYWSRNLSQKASQDDQYYGIKTTTNSTAAGTACTLFGAVGSGNSQLGQDASSRTVFRLHSTNNQTYTTDTKIQNNTRYAIGRSTSLLFDLYKSGVSVSSKSAASNSIATGANLMDIGCLMGGTPDTPSPGTYMQVGVKYFWASRFSGFDIIQWEGFMERILSVL